MYFNYYKCFHFTLVIALKLTGGKVESEMAVG